MNENETDAAILWRDWNEASFEDARIEGKPVLLTLGATWCHWCHVMDQRAYADPRVIDLVNSRFIPVRVDVDQRPDISLRYNQGGYPSVAFLTGDGEFLTGRPYTPPDEMVTLLERVSRGEVVTAPLQAAEPGESPAAYAGDAPVERVLARLAELYDDRFGGFGLEPKQPPWEALRLLMLRYSLTGDRTLLAMAETTLQGMWQGIYDNKDKGFFRYSVSRDWKVPHYEKMLVTNASLAMTYLDAYLLTRKPDYRAAASGILDYLLNNLFSPADGLFSASQDADEPYYQGSWKDRDAATGPPIDTTFYAGWNALAAQALVQATEALGRTSWRRLATNILEKLWQESWTATGGLCRVAGESSISAPILGDQVNFLQAWLALYQSTGNPYCLTRAVEVAAATQQLFGASGGGCHDTTAPRPFEASLLPREQPALDNAHWAEALVVLSHLVDHDSYQQQAAGALQIFESVIPGRSYLGDRQSRHMEEDEEALFLPAGSAWAQARDLWDNGPVRLALVGDSSEPAYRQLHRAAARVYAPHRVVLPLDRQRNARQIRQLGFPSRAEPALYVCMGERCLTPVVTPAEVRDLARSRPWAAIQYPETLAPEQLTASP
jgi:uncharacterized protein YyaL (SSP411 family)